VGCRSIVLDHSTEVRLCSDIGKRSEEESARGPALQERVKNVALVWTTIANIKFDFVQEGNADIRIAFQEGRGSWSYLGTVARQIDETEPTMNYRWLTDDSTDDAVRRVVLHEFGHALGLIHEHQNPNRAIQWNRDAVINDLQGPPNNSGP
jgi:serralysin